MIEVMQKAAFSKARKLAISLLPFKGDPRPGLEASPCIPVPASGFEILDGPGAFRRKLMELIAQARTRILLPVLYLQDDDAGREILEALYAAKAAHPVLQIEVFVDLHRAQRGLIGKARSEGNAAMYREMARRLGPGVPIHGIPVQTRELMGVMHLKGFVLDDQVLYSGASFNDVYLHRHERYRLDRYHLIRSRELADSLATLLTRVILRDPAVQPLGGRSRTRMKPPRAVIASFRRHLKEASCAFAAGTPHASEIGVTPLLGLGRRGNDLNATLLQVVEHARQRLVLFTPYFNLPRPIHKAVRERLRAGCRVTIVLGDKTANDFYIPPSEPFRAIGSLPYLYESNLRRFCKSQQHAIDQGLLDVHLWKHGNNTFHLKGLWADGEYSVLTGNNLNPRAWWLDLENGLLVRDPQRLLERQYERELETILRHAKRLTDHREIETMADYPVPVQRFLKKLTRPLLDRLINQIL